jgi:hypothetical protein
MNESLKSSNADQNAKEYKIDKDTEQMLLSGKSKSIFDKKTTHKNDE